MSAIEDIAAERQRQIEAEGWTSEHDDTHRGGEMAAAAGCYAIHSSAVLSGESVAPRFWPWSVAWWKPKNRRRDLVRAGALIVAEIERLDRLSAAGQ